MQKNKILESGRSVYDPLSMEAEKRWPTTSEYNLPRQKAKHKQEIFKAGAQWALNIINAPEMESCMRFQRFIHDHGRYVQDAQGKWREYGHVTGKESDVIPTEEIWKHYNKFLLTLGGI